MTGVVPAFLTDPALVAVLDALPDARVVGGAVRDTLAGRPVADIDLATASVPTDVVAALARVGIRSVPTGLDHGTVTAISGGRGFEITTLRRDVATDGRRATVAFSTDWREDAERRDFTINAMSMGRNGTVYDYFGGIADLRAGVLRFVGDPAVRIAEDYLRIPRFFRFYARYGIGAPDPAAVAAIRAGVPGLAALSVERVWHELHGLLAVPSCEAAVALMAETGVLAAVLPEGASVGALERLLEAGAPADPVLRLAALLTGDALAVAVRLKLSVADRDRLVALRLPCPVAPGDDDAMLRRALAAEDPAVLVGRAWLTGAGEPDWARLRERLLAIPRPLFPLEGRHVLGLGVPPGPQVGTLLREVRSWWLDRGCQDDAAACLAALRERMGGAVFSSTA